MNQTGQASDKSFKLIICTGIIFCLIYLFIARYYGPDTHAAIPQPDTLSYQQYARAIAEGHPYRFNADEAPTTGSTSHIYPFRLGLCACFLAVSRRSFACHSRMPSEERSSHTYFLFGLMKLLNIKPNFDQVCISEFS